MIRLSLVHLYLRCVCCFVDSMFVWFNSFAGSKGGREIYQAMPTHILVLMEANGLGKRDLGVMLMVFFPRTSSACCVVAL